MVNIFNYAKKVKANAMERRERKEKERAIRTANQLKEMRKERIKKEGRERIYLMKEKEEARLKKANLNLRKRTPAYRIANAVKDNYKRYKKNKKPGLFDASNFR